MSDVKPLTARQRRAVEAVLACGTLKAAARRAGVSYSTLRDWAKRPEFQAAVQEAGRQALAVVLAGIQGAGPDAVRALRRALGDADVDVRLRAADKLLGHLPKLAGFVELYERVAELEARADAREQQR
jgi:phage terminase small subunit